MTIETILHALPKLNREERERVARYIEHLRRFDDPAFLEGLADRIEILKTDIVRTLKLLGVGSTGALDASLARRMR